MATYEQSRKKVDIYNRRKRNRRKRNMQMIKRCGLIFGVAVIAVALITKVPGMTKKKEKAEDVVAKAPVQEELVVQEPEYDVQLLTPNEFSRPQIALEKVKGIVVHYTANAGTTAQQNRDYFEGLKDAQKTKASSHFIVGLDGEIIQCIPTKEIAYASNERNFDTLSIENCHPDATGKFEKSTYDTLVHLSAWLLTKFNLTTNDLIRHYDISGKACPLYFVDNQDEWDAFKQDVEEYIDKNGIKKET